jgi:hypothetical protein
MPLLSSFGGGSARGFGHSLSTGPEPFDAIDFGSRTFLSLPKLSFSPTASGDTSINGPNADDDPYNAHTNFNANNVTIEDSGTRMYVALFSYGTIQGFIYQYDLTTAYDITTASFAGRYDCSSYSIARNPRAVRFKPDGTKMFVLNDYNNALREFNLSTAWDVTTASYTGQSRYAGGGTPTSLYMKPDGTKWWAGLSQSFDTVTQQTMTTAWDLSTSTSGSTNKYQVYDDGLRSPTGLFLTSNRMFVTNLSGGTSAAIYQWNLGSSWDITSNVTFVGAYSMADYRLSNNFYGLHFDNGNDFYVSGVGGEVLKLRTSSSYNFSSGTISYKQTPTTHYFQPFRQSTYGSYSGISMSSDGTKLYIIDDATNYVNQYNLSTAWNLSSISGNSPSSTTSFGLLGNGYYQDMWFKPDGTAFYYVTSQNRCYSYGLSTAWDISSTVNSSSQLVLSGGNYFKGCAFSPDGTKFFTSESNGNTIIRYDLSTAWDITTGSQTSSVSIGTTSSYAVAISISSNGRQLFVKNQFNYDKPVLTEYELGTAWDITTATYYDTHQIADVVPNSFRGCFYMRPDGEYAAFIGGRNTGHVVSYSMPTPSVR